MPQRFKSTLILSAAVAVALLSASPGRSAAPGKGGQIPSGPGLIAFTEGVNADAWINVMYPDGTGRRRVAFADKSYAGPVWSPVLSDGTVKLAWGDHDKVTRSFLVIADVPTDGGPLVPFEIPATAETLPGSDRPDTIDDLNWSPPYRSGDGLERVRISYQTTADDPTKTRLIRVIITLVYQPDGNPSTCDFDIEGSPLILDPGPEYGYTAGRFSPDGTLLALCRSEFGPVYSIWLANSNGLEVTSLITPVPGSWDRNPAWSPDGSQLAFVSNRDGSRNGNIYLAQLGRDTAGKLTATSITRLTNVKSGCSWSCLDWSPDGKQLTYRNGWNYSNIRVCKIMLPTGGSFDLVGGSLPDWSPFAWPWPLPGAPTN